MQIILEQGFGISSGSIGSLISHYFLEVEDNVGRYLDILVKVIDYNSAWCIEKETMKKIINMVWDSQNEVTY